jgi:demethylmenaquinone methyltransferase/2-methoxy-6-polyprenyl-1,4-benzoquinol methylase
LFFSDLFSKPYIELWRSLQNDGVLSRLKDNSRLCDCGIGTAAFSLAFVKASHLNAHITGVDISSQMLSNAHQRISQANVKHQLCQSNVNTLPFTDNSFDVVTVAHMLEHLPNPIQGLHEMVRVLRPGAPLILAVTRSGLLGWLIQWYWGNDCFSQNALVEMLTQAGLTNVQFYAFTVGVSRWTSIACVGFKP